MVTKKEKPCLIEEVKRVCTILCATILLAGCESDPHFWNQERCFSRLEGDVEDLAEYKEKYEKAMKSMELHARRGDTEQGERYRTTANNWIKSIKQRLEFIDGELTDLCNTLDPGLMQKADEFRTFVNDTGEVQSMDADPMPDLVVTDIRHEFVPYEIGETGKCIGPYLDLIVTVANNGGDYPREGDWKVTKERVKTPLEDMGLFTTKLALDYGDTAGTESVTVKRAEFAEGVFPAGARRDFPLRLKVGDGQTHLTISASVGGAYFFETGNEETKYTTSISIPMWDIYTQSSKTYRKEHEGTHYAQTQVEIANLGETATPGPVDGTFSYLQEEGGKVLSSWKGTTGAPIPAGEVMHITGDEKKFDTELSATFALQSSISLRCPDGTSGSLSDGNARNNYRSLIAR